MIIFYKIKSILCLNIYFFFFRYYVCLGVAITLFLILMCLTLGLFCGFCGSRPEGGYHDDCCNKGTGASYLMMYVLENYIIILKCFNYQYFYVVFQGCVVNIFVISVFDDHSFILFCHWCHYRSYYM